MICMTALLGYIAITPNPTVANPQLNYPFLAIMVVLTALLAAAMVLRPMRFTIEELRLLVGAPIVLGLPILAFGTYQLATAGRGNSAHRHAASSMSAPACSPSDCFAWAARGSPGGRGRGPMARSPRAVGEPAGTAAAVRLAATRIGLPGPAVAACDC